MYRDREDYEKIAEIAIDIYCDYDIKQFPVPIFDICKKLGIVSLPYSEFTPKHQKILLKKSTDAFYVPPTSSSKPQIYYNDLLVSKGRIRYNIAHEIKHYVCNDNI